MKRRNNKVTSLTEDRVHTETWRKKGREDGRLVNYGGRGRKEGGKERIKKGAKGTKREEMIRNN